MSSAERRTRKNAKSRARDAAYRQRMQQIHNKPPEEWTEEETKEVQVFTLRRQLKNQRSKNRIQNQKVEMDRIEAKPMHERTVEETIFLQTQIERKVRKNRGDRYRRKREMYKEGEVPEEYTLKPLTRRRHGTTTMQLNNKKLPDLLLPQSLQRKQFHHNDDHQDDAGAAMLASAISSTDVFASDKQLLLSRLITSQLSDEAETSQEQFIMFRPENDIVSPPSLPLLLEYVDAEHSSRIPIPGIPMTCTTGVNAGHGFPAMHQGEKSLLQASFLPPPQVATPIDLDFNAQQSVPLRLKINPSNFVLPIQPTEYNNMSFQSYPMSNTNIATNNQGSPGWAEPASCFCHDGGAVAVPAAQQSIVSLGLWNSANTTSFCSQNLHTHHNPQAIPIHPFPIAHHDTFTGLTLVDCEQGTDDQGLAFALDSQDGRTNLPHAVHLTMLPQDEGIEYHACYKSVGYRQGG